MERKEQQKYFIVTKDEIMKLPMEHPCLDGEDMSFSFIDSLQANVYIKIGFYYESENVPEDFELKLKSTLQKLVEERYPELTGSIHHENDFLILKHSNNGYRFVEAKSNAEDLDFNDLPPEFYPGSEIFLNRAILQSDPVFMVQVTRMPKGTLLTMSANHLLSDIYGLMLFYIELATAYKGVPISGKARPERSLLPICKLKNFYSVSPSQNQWPAKRFHVGKSTLEKFKIEYMEELGDKSGVKFLSSNDIIVAVFWKAAMKAKGILKSSAAMVVECRQQLELPKDFFSNAVYLSSICDIDVSNTSYSEMAGLVRKNVTKSSSKEVLRSFIDRAKKAEFIDELHVANRINFAKEGFLITSGSKFSGGAAFNFGFGNLTHFSSYAQTNWNMLVITQYNPEEFVVFLKLKEEEEIARLENDPEIQKLLLF